MHCLKCKYIKIDTSKLLAYTCDKFGFSTNTYPNVKVLEITNKKCPFFISNQPNAQNNIQNKLIFKEFGDINYEI